MYNLRYNNLNSDETENILKNKSSDSCLSNKSQISEEQNNLYSKTMHSENRSQVYEKLHGYAGKIKNNKIMLACEIYSEKNGLTFKPKINNNKKYNTTLDFFERDKNFVKLKKENLTKLKQEKNEKESLILPIQITKSKDEREINNKNIVDRLYKKEMEKIKEEKEKKIEEKKNLDKKNSKTKDEIESNIKRLVKRLYSDQIKKSKEKNLTEKDLEINDLEENNNFSTIKNKNEKINPKKHEKKYVSPLKNDDNLLKKLKKEHKIKFNKNDFLTDRKSIQIISPDNLLKDVNKESPNKIKSEKKEKNILFQSLNKKNSINPYKTNDNCENFNKNSSIRKEREKRSILNNKNESKEKNFENENFKNLEKRKSNKNNYNLSPIKRNNNENSYSEIEIQNNINNVSNKSSFKYLEDENKSNFNEKIFDNLNSKSNILDEKYDIDNLSKDEVINCNKNKSFTFKETNLSNFSKIYRNNYENNIILTDHNLSNTNHDNFEGSHGIEVKENKFKSKALERILNTRKNKN